MKKFRFEGTLKQVEDAKGETKVELNGVSSGGDDWDTGVLATQIDFVIARFLKQNGWPPERRVRITMEALG